MESAASACRSTRSSAVVSCDARGRQRGFPTDRPRSSRKWPRIAPRSAAQRGHRTSRSASTPDEEPRLPLRSLARWRTPARRLQRCARRSARPERRRRGSCGQRPRDRGGTDDAGRWRRRLRWRQRSQRRCRGDPSAEGARGAGRHARRGGLCPFSGHNGGWLPPGCCADDATYNTLNEIGIVEIAPGHRYAVAILARRGNDWYGKQAPWVERASCVIYRAASGTPKASLDCND